MYRHTQFGWVMFYSSLAAIAIDAAIAGIVPPPKWPALAVMPVLLITLILFINLTVTVDGEAVRIVFGIGLIRKAFRLPEIRSVQPVRNPILYGWGIHLTPRGWLFNVSGFEAVELEMKNGRRYRIGTDEPEKLCETIRARLGR